jgi:hypothetical protein
MGGGASFIKTASHTELDPSGARGLPTALRRAQNWPTWVERRRRLLDFKGTGSQEVYTRCASGEARLGSLGLDEWLRRSQAGA